MSNRFSFFFIFIFVACFSFAAAQQRLDQQLWEKARAIHEKAVVVDTHCDVPDRMLEEKKFDIGKRNSNGHVDLVRMKEGGLDAEFFSVYVSNALDEKNPSREALKRIDTIRSVIKRYPSLAEIATSTSDILRLKREGKRAILMGMENGSPVEGSLERLRKYYALGIRYVTLTHMHNNPICDSSTDTTERWHGLSPFGRTMIQEMNRLGIMIDISHVSDKAAFQAIALSTKPVIASHSCARALCDVPRNMSDSLLRAVKKNGGVVMVNFYPSYLDMAYNKKITAIYDTIRPQMEAAKEKYKNNRDSLELKLDELHAKLKIEPPQVAVLIDHIDHMVKIMGVDHVGLGSDFDGIPSTPAGLEDVGKLPIITYELLRRGYPDSDIRKILGENILRVMAANEKIQ
ncbi:MAG: dipeptidase [Bacteroidota bacterium]